MKFITYLYLISFYLATTTSIKYRDPSLFISLIKAVRQQYATNAVFFAYPTAEYRHYDGLKTLRFAHVWCRQLDNEGIFTIGVKIGDIPTVVKYYTTIVRPLIVVFLLGSYGFHEFSNVTSSVRMSYAAWLIIFVPISIEHDYCYEPPGNAFSLTFDTQMVVVCYDDQVLREWYSVDGNTTTIFPFAKWNNDYAQNDSLEVIEKFTDLGIHERRSNLNGKILRGVTVKTSPLVRIHDNKLYGYFGKIIKELENALNFTLEIVSNVKLHGSLNVTTKKWNGAVGIVTSGQAEFGISDFVMTTTRLDYVDYTIPLLTSRSCLYLKQPDFPIVKWFVYYRTFHTYVWIDVVILIVIAQGVLVFIRSFSHSSSYTYMMHEEFLRVWGVFCSQGISDFPRTSSLRLSYVFLFLTAIVLSAVYSGSLIVFLTARNRDPLYHSIEAFLNDGTHNIIVQESSAAYDMFFYANDSMTMRLMELMRPLETLPSDLEQGFRQICEDSKLAFYSSELSKRILNERIPCNVFCIDFGRVESLGMILPKGSQYTTVVNYHLQKFLSSGLLNRFKNITESLDFDWGVKIQPVGLGSIASLLLILFLGILLALVVLLLEIYIHRSTSVDEVD